MQNITATHINYYHICQRKLWFFSHGIQMEQTSDLVYDGKLLHETSYPQRAAKYTEVQLGNIKIDFYDAKEKVIHEIKRSKAAEVAHEWQVKYYIYVMEQAGIEGVTGILEYPKARISKEIFLSNPDRTYLEEVLQNITQLLAADCPKRIKKSLCKSCAYFDFCWVAETDNDASKTPKADQA